MNGKGDRDRTTDKKAYDKCPLWNNMNTKRHKTTEEVEEIILNILDEYAPTFRALAKGPEGAHIVTVDKESGK